MSTDRELLELAAKAAGFGAPGSGRTIWTLSEYPKRSGRHGALWNYVGNMDTAELWNPLADDGDALRLAVDLDLAIVPYPIYNKKKHSVLVQKKNLDESRFEKMELQGDDPRAATRRAIVRVAAEIGKAMP